MLIALHLKSGCLHKCFQQLLNDQLPTMNQFYVFQVTLLTQREQCESVRLFMVLHCHSNILDISVGWELREFQDSILSQYLRHNTILL